MYIGLSGHVETLGEVSGATFFNHVYRLDMPGGDSRGSLCSKFFFKYIGWTSHVQSVGEVSGVLFSSRI
jgi:hypothetical protein